MDEDIILVEQCLKGDSRAYEKLIVKYNKPIFRLAARLVRYSDDAEEVTQSVFVKAYEKLSSYNPQYKFFSWLYRITVNESLNFLRDKNYITEADESIGTEEENPGNIYDHNETSKKIENALYELDLLYRVPVVLKHFMNYSYKELSDLLNVPEKTVKSRLFTGRQLLKDILIKNGILEK